MELKWNVCPFCGNEIDVNDELTFTSRENFYKNIEEFGRATISVRCNNCHVEMYEHTDTVLDYDDKMELLNKQWNRREELISEVWKVQDALNGRIAALTSENESLNKSIDSLRDMIKDERADSARRFRELNELKDAIIRRFVKEAEE